MYQSLVDELLSASTATLEVWRSAKILTLERHNLPFDRVRIAEQRCRSLPMGLASEVTPVVRSAQLAVCKCALCLSRSVFRAKSCTSVFLAGKFL